MIETSPGLASPLDNGRLLKQMVPCLLCSSPRSIGVLCTSHGVAIAAPGITSEQIFSRVQDAKAALVDAWGCAHGIADGSRVGRDPRVDLPVLHASVLTDHAQLKQTLHRPASRSSLPPQAGHSADSSARSGTSPPKLST